MSHEKLVKDNAGRLFTAVLTIICSSVGFLFREAYQEQQRRLQVLEALAVERGATIARLSERADAGRTALEGLAVSERECGRAVSYLSEAINELKSCCKENRDRISQTREKR